MFTSLYFREVWAAFTGMETAGGTEACGEASGRINEAAGGGETAAGAAACEDEMFLFLAEVCGFLTGKSFPVTGKITTSAGAAA